MGSIGDLSARRYTRLEQPVAVSTEKPQSDQVLDLSGPQLKEELLGQDLSQVKAIKVGDQFFQLSATDLRKLVNDLKQAVLSKGEIKPDFQALRFVENTGIVLEHKPDLDRQAAQKSTYYRGRERDQIRTPADASQALKSDLALTGPGGTYDASKPHNASIAGKMLVQDLVVLERMGVMSPEDKAAFDAIMSRLRPANQGGFAAGDVKALYDLAKKYSDSMPAELPQRSAEQTALDAADAASNDLKMAMKESGYDKGIKAGRSIERVDRAVKAVTAAHDQLVTHISAAKQELDTAVQAYQQNLMRVTGTSNPADAQRAYAADPGRYDADPGLGQARTAKDQALGHYEALTTKRQELGKLRLQGLSTVSTMFDIKTQNQRATRERVEGMNRMSSNLVRGIDELKAIQREIDARANGGTIFLPGTMPGVDGGNVAIPTVEATPEEEKQTLEKLRQELEQKEAKIKQLGGRVNQVRNDMIKGMDDLINQVQASRDRQAREKTLSPVQLAQIDKVIETLKAQRESLKQLGPNPSLATIEKLEATRKAMIDQLKTLPASVIDQKEVTALENLDGHVREYSDTDLATSSRASEAQEQVEHELAKTSAYEEALRLEEEAAKSKALGGTDMVEFFRTAAGGSKIDLYVIAGGRIGTRSNNLHAEAGLHLIAEKRDVGFGERYMLQLGASFELGLDLDFEIIELHFAVTLEKMLKGVAFATPQQAAHFLSLLGEMVDALKRGDGDAASAAWDKAKLYAKPFMMQSDSSVGGSTSKQIGSEDGVAVGWEGELKFGRSALPRVDDKGEPVKPPEMDYVSTETLAGGFNVTVGGKEISVTVAREVSTVSDKNGRPRMRDVEGKPGKKVPDSKEEISVEAKVPIAMLYAMLTAVKGSPDGNLPKELEDKLLATLMNGSQDFDGMDEGQIRSSLRQMLAAALKDKTLVAKILQMGRQMEKVEKADKATDDAPIDVSADFHATIALKYGSPGPGKPKSFKIEVGFEAKAEVEAAVGKGAQAYIKVGVELKYAEEFWSSAPLERPPMQLSIDPAMIDDYRRKNPGS
ncbi:MAG: hypothetical protein ACAI44_26065 [Candidatus Sericytochromatia bacterium]